MFFSESPIFGKLFSVKWKEKKSYSCGKDLIICIERENENSKH